MFNATDVYGAGPIAGGPQGSPASGRTMKVISGGRGAPAPSAEAMHPSTMNVAGIADDPTFWLVAILGAAAGLAIWSS